LSLASADKKNTIKCGTNSQDGQVVKISDGKYERCYSLITPKTA